MSLKSFFASMFAPDPVFWDDLSHEGWATLKPHENLFFRPRLVTPTLAPTREEFATWRDNPITEFVMAALVRNAEECREQWINHSWDNGVADQAELIALRERSDALLGFTADYDAFCETLGLEPQPLEVDDAA